MDEENIVWHVQDLLDLNVTNRSMPTEEDGRRMVDELNSEFMSNDDDYPSPNDLVSWSASKFFIDLDTFTFDVCSISGKFDSVPLFTLFY